MSYNKQRELSSVLKYKQKGSLITSAFLYQELPEYVGPQYREVHPRSTTGTIGKLLLQSSSQLMEVGCLFEVRLEANVQNFVRIIMAIKSCLAMITLAFLHVKKSIRWGSTFSRSAEVIMTENMNNRAIIIQRFLLQSYNAGTYFLWVVEKDSVSGKGLLAIKADNSFLAQYKTTMLSRC